MWRGWPALAGPDDEVGSVSYGRDAGRVRLVDPLDPGAGLFRRLAEPLVPGDEPAYPLLVVGVEVPHLVELFAHQGPGMLGVEQVVALGEQQPDVRPDRDAAGQR